MNDSTPSYKTSLSTSHSIISLKKLVDLYCPSTQQKNNYYKNELKNKILQWMKLNDSFDHSSLHLPNAQIPKDQLGAIGKHFGFFKIPPTPLTIVVFTTKGGVLKSTLSLNIARTLALHGLKVCVVGLDIQGDITNALGIHRDVEQLEASDRDEGLMQELMGKLDQTSGLYDVFMGQKSLKDIICPTDLKELWVIPETPELVGLNDHFNHINRREFWLKEKIVDHLYQDFDVVIMDCSPNWNRLTTNALVACDVLISPLECKINNFRNFKVFGQFLKEFKKDMRLDFHNIFIPTKFSQNKKLTMEIKNWYHHHVYGCSHFGLRENVASEEAMALNISLLEYEASSSVGLEMKSLLEEIAHRLSLIHPQKHTLDSSQDLAQSLFLQGSKDQILKNKEGAFEYNQKLSAPFIKRDLLDPLNTQT